MTDQTRASRKALVQAAVNAEQPIALEGELVEDYKPTVPKKVRDGVYWATLGVAAASLLTSGLAGIWTPDIAPQVLATTGVVTGVMGVIGGGVGVVYRPGAN